MLEGEPEVLGDGDEVITRRWEFYKYIGPYDTENHEAISNEVADDDLHGVGVSTAAGFEYDLDITIVVGEFLGAQMSAFDVDAELYLIDHLQDCEVGQAAPDRRVVVPGLAAFAATGILSGTPTASGDFSYEVEASDPSYFPLVRNTNTPFLFPIPISLRPSPFTSPTATCVPTPESSSSKCGTNSAPPSPRFNSNQ